MSSVIPVHTNNPIKSHYWNQVLYLLGSALFADGYPSKNKLDAFLDVAIELKFVIDPTAKFRRQTLRAWYKIREKEWNKAHSLDYDDFVLTLLKEISIYGHKVDILTALVQIIIADGQYSDRAQHLIKHTVMLWSIPAKHMDDIVYVCSDLMKPVLVRDQASLTH